MPQLVSIIMPFKNTAPYLRECIESIMLQDYPYWELIAVDDYSDDHSYSILKKYSEQDSRITVLKNSGRGIVEATSLGYQHTRGAFITRMDSDDKMTKQKLRLMTQTLSANGPGHLAVGLVKYFNDDGLNEGYLKYEHWLNSLTRRGDNFKEIYKECSIPSPNWMCYRDDFDQVGGFKAAVYPEDYDLAFRFYYGKLKVLGIPEVTHQWRDYIDRTSRTDDHYADNSFTSLKIKYFKQYEMDERPLVVWGAGRKGKLVAHSLIAAGIPFRWITNNEKKIEKHIYSVKIEATSSLSTMHNSRVIIAISQQGVEEEIKTLQSQNDNHMYTNFC